MAGQPFPQDITAGGQIVIPSIYSPNFVHSISGWSINSDGSAEFNNLTIRGTYLGTHFILNASGAFFYYGTPAFGNMALSIAPNAGTDQFGNAFPDGIALSVNGGIGNEIQLRPSKEAIFVYAG